MADAAVLSFATAADFRRWLAKEHAKSDGFWMRIARKGAGERSITYAQALDEALCFGWIDGQKKPLDDRAWLQKFTPRRARSGWSKRNTEHVERLAKAGLMHQAGLVAVEAAKADGRWAAAYASPRDANVPQDFLVALRRNRWALKFFESLNRANLYAIVYLLNTAKKPETRARRMKSLLAMMRAGTAIHPPRPKR